MVVIGSIVGIENSQAFGCVTGLEMISLGNLVFLIISSILLYRAIKTSDSKILYKLLILETIIWIAKYLFYKGGYVTGFGGTANPTNVVYDFIAIGFRLWIILSISNYHKFKLITSVLVSVLFVVLKIYVFAFPWFSRTMWELEDKRTEKQRIEILGNYTGTINQISNNEKRPIELRIDSNQMSIINEQPFNLKEDYHFGLDYLNIGGIGTENGLEYDISIEKLDEDSLILNFEYMYEIKYNLKLKTER